MIRGVKLSEVQDKVVDQLSMRLTERADNFSNEDLIKYLKTTQETLNKTLSSKCPLIIFRSKKGFTLPNINDLKLEGNTKVHKNPLQGYTMPDKLDIVKKFLKFYEEELFDNADNLNIDNFKFKTESAFSNKQAMKNISIKENRQYAL